MNPDEQHIALPKLYGAPAYARPPRVFEVNERPPDPDDLPLEVFRDDEAAGLAAPAAQPVAVATFDLGPGDTPVPLGAGEPDESEMSSEPSVMGPASGIVEVGSGTEGAAPASPSKARGLGRFIQRR